MREIKPKNFNMKRFLLPNVLAVFLVLCLFVLSLSYSIIKTRAASYYWVGGASGDANNWSNANNWSSSSGGEGGAGVPTSADSITFDSGSSVPCTLSASGDASSITNTNYAGTLSLGSNTLTVAGAMNYNSGSLNLGSGTLNVASTLDFRGVTLTAGSSTVILSGTTNSSIWGGNNTFNNLTLTSTKNIPFVSGGSSNFKIAGILDVADSVGLQFNLNAQVTLLKGSTLDLNTSGILDQISSSSIVVEDPTASTIPTGGTIEVATYLDAKTQDIFVLGRLYGNLYIRNVSVSSNYTATLGTAGSQTISAGSFRMYANGTGNLTVDSSVYNPTVSLGVDISYRYYFGFAGTGNGSEILKAGSSTWNIGSSDVDFRNGTLTAGSSNFNFCRGNGGAYNQYVYSGGNTFNQITNANLDADGLIFLDSVSATTFTQTVPVGYYKTQFQAGTTATFTNFDVSGSSGKVLIFAPYGSNASWYLNVTNAPTISYVSVSYSDASGGALISAVDGTSTDGGNNNNWDFGKRYWVASAEGNWSDTSNWSYGSGGSAGATIPGATSQVYFNSAGNINCNIDQDATVVSITVDSGYEATINAASATITVTGNVDLTGGTFTAGTSSIVFGGSGAQTFTSGGKTLNVLTVTNSSVAGVTIYGSLSTTTLNAITANSKIKFDDTAIFTVTSVFNVGGSASGKVSLFSDTDNNQWDLHIPNDMEKQYLNVKDSVADHVVTCNNSTDSGNNNTNWVFSFALTDNLQANWQFDDNYNDYSGNADNGTNSGSTITASGVLVASGKNPAQAGASFDGGDYVNVGNPANGSLALGTGSYSLSSWFKTSMGAGTTGRLISKGHWGWTIGYALSVVEGKVEFGTGGGTQARSVLTRTTSLFNDGNWHHAVGVHDAVAQVEKIYVDGVLQSIEKVTSTCGTVSGTTINFSACTYLNATTTANLYLGAATTSAGLLIGSIDDARVYNRPLETGDVGRLYNNTYNGTAGWSEAGNWATGQLPGQEATVTVGSGIMTLDSSYQISKYQMSGGTIDFSTNTLTVTKNANFSNGVVTPGTGSLVLSGTTAQTLTCNNQSFYNITSTNASNLIFADDCNITGTLTDSTPSSTLTFAAGSTYNINNLSLNGQAIDTRILLVSGTPSTQWVLNISGTASVSYVNVTDSDASGGDTITANNGTSLNGGNNLNWLFPASNKYWVGSSSSWNNSANWSDTSGGAGGAGVPSLADTAIFNIADSTSCVLDTNINITSIQSTDFAGELDASNKTISLLGDLTFKSGTLNMGTDSWTVSGNIDLAGSTLNGNSSTLVMIANGKTITTGSASINDLIIRNSGNTGITISLSGDLVIGDDLYLQANANGNTTLNGADHNISVVGELDFTGTGSGTEILDMGSGIWTVSSTINLINGSVTADTSKLILNGDINTAIWGGNNTLYSLTIQTNKNIPYIYDRTSDFKVAGTLEIANSKRLELNLGTKITFLKGSNLNLNTSGELYAIVTSSAIFEDPTSSSISESGAVSLPIYFDAITQDISIPVRNYGSSVYIRNTSASDRTLILGTAQSQSIDFAGSLMFYASSSGNLTVDASVYNPNISTTYEGGHRRYFGFYGTGEGSEILKAGSGTWTIGAADVDFRNGTLNAGGSTFIFNREYSLWNQVVYSGGNSFYKIINANSDWHGSTSGLSFLDNVRADTISYTNPLGSYRLQFAAGTTATFANFNVSGQSGKVILLTAYESSNAWNLNIANQPTVSYINVSNCNASAGSQIIANNGTNIDGGNNLNWLFTLPASSSTSSNNNSSGNSNNSNNQQKESSSTATDKEKQDEDDSSYIDTVFSDIIEVVDGQEITGRADANTIVEVIVDGETYKTVADSDGNWKILINKPAGSYDAKVKLTKVDGTVIEKDITIKVLSATTGGENKNSISNYYLYLLLFILLLVIILVIFKRRRK